MTITQILSLDIDYERKTHGQKFIEEKKNTINCSETYISNVFQTDTWIHVTSEAQNTKFITATPFDLFDINNKGFVNNFGY